jgi:hypothetical protein
MSIRNVIALLSHVGRSELLPRWQSEEVDDELLTDIDLDNFKILGLTDPQARTAVAFKTGGFRLQLHQAAIMVAWCVCSTTSAGRNSYQVARFSLSFGAFLHFLISFSSRGS